jgi:hypothetical protein
MHFRWARTVVFWALASTVLIFFTLQYQMYWIVSFAERMAGTAIVLNDLLTGQGPGPTIFSQWRTFRMIFLEPPFLVGDLIALLYVLGVSYYFTRPKVRERFA